jgi:hypothetical protein
MEPDDDRDEDDRVVHTTFPTACLVCSRLGGKLYRSSEAPPIPVVGCTNAECRCEYVPYWDW